MFNICLPHFKFHKSMEFVFTINFYSLKAWHMLLGYRTVHDT